MEGQNRGVYLLQKNCCYAFWPAFGCCVLQEAGYYNFLASFQTFFIFSTVFYFSCLKRGKTMWKMIKMQNSENRQYCWYIGISARILQLNGMWVWFKINCKVIVIWFGFGCKFGARLNSVKNLPPDYNCNRGVTVWHNFD